VVKMVSAKRLAPCLLAMLTISIAQTTSGNAYAVSAFPIHALPFCASQYW
jgi:hypothetical protein